MNEERQTRFAKAMEAISNYEDWCAAMGAASRTLCEYGSLLLAEMLYQRAAKVAGPDGDVGKAMEKVMEDTEIEFCTSEERVKLNRLRD